MAVYPTMSKKQKLKSREFNSGLILTIVFSMVLLNLFFNFFNILSSVIRGSIGLVSYPICAFFIIVGILKMLDVRIKVTNKTILLIILWLVAFISILQIPTSVFNKV